MREPLRIVAPMLQRSLFPLPFVALSVAVCSSVALAQQRIPWTTSRIQGTPEPPPPYVVDRVEPGLTFNKPLDITPMPGSDRLVVLEESGRMLVTFEGWRFRIEIGDRSDEG